MKKTYFRSALAALAVAIAMPAAAQDESSVVFTYSPDDPVYSSFGTKKAETYDVAISLASPAFAGKKITKINVPVPAQAYREQTDDSGNTVNTPCFSDLKVWVATDLEKVTAEGTELSFVAPQDWPEANDEGIDFAWVQVEVPADFVIPAEGVYVGYTMTVDLLEAGSKGASRTPVVVTAGDREGALWVRTTRTYKQWGDRGQINGVVSPLSVVIAGSFPANSLTVTGIEPYRAGKGEKGQVTIHVSNTGTEVVNSINYLTTFGDASFEGTLDLSKNPIPAIFNYPADVVVEVPASDVAGTLELSVAVTKVNGEANTADHLSAAIQASVPLFIPANTPIVEEFTGTGCGYCPRGFAAMEEMATRYPDTFIGVAWHGYNNSDPMYAATGYPSIFSGAPSCAYNRGSVIDPYYAYQNQNGFSMPQYFEDYTKAYVPVEVLVDAEWTDDTCTQIEATATLNWASLPENPNAEYRVEFILVGDDLYGDTDDWKQSNYYAGGNYGVIEYMEEFCTTNDSYVAGLHFNDVALISSGIGGIQGSIESINPGTPNVVKYTITPAKAVNGKKQTIAFHPWALRVVALVLEAGKGPGKGINAGRCDVPAPSGINNAVAEREVVATTYVDLAGRTVKNPTPGIYVQINRLSDGTSVSRKVVIR